jgi:preflagellin peptidase FlaK
VLSLEALPALEAVVLMVALGVASYLDWKVREVPDGLWILLTLVGAILLELGSWGESPLVLSLNLIAILFVLEHFLPWEDTLGDHSWAILGVEVAIYAAVLGSSAYAYLVLLPGVFLPFYEIVGMVVLARVLFEVGALYGGADAKALMAAAVVLPVLSSPFLVGYPLPAQGSVLALLPFAFTMLINGGILTLVVPLVLLVVNLRRGERSFPHILHMVRIPTEELPRRFVWLRDPPLESASRDDSTEEDQALRIRQAEKLRAMGVGRVWVTPQLPFLISLTAGALVGLLMGNLLIWVLAIG